MIRNLQLLLKEIEGDPGSKAYFVPEFIKNINAEIEKQENIVVAAGPSINFDKSKNDAGKTPAEIKKIHTEKISS